MSSLITPIVNTGLSVSGFYMLKRFLRSSLSNWGPYAKSNNKKQLEIEIISLFHAFVFAYHGFKTVTSIVITDNYVMDLSSQKISLFSIGYFIQDLISCYRENILTMSSVIHHLTMIWCNSYILYSRGANSVLFKFYSYLGIGELSTIFLQLLNIMRIISLRQTKHYKYIAFLFAISFFTTRLLWSPYIIYKNINSSTMVTYGRDRWVILMFPLLNTWWFRLIIKKMRRTFTPKIEP